MITWSLFDGHEERKKASEDLGMSLSMEHWKRTWRAQISYARNAKSFEEFDYYCKNACRAQRELLIAEVSK